MSRHSGLWLCAALAAGILTGATGAVFAQFSDEEFGTDASQTAPVDTPARVPRPDRKPANVPGPAAKRPAGGAMDRPDREPNAAPGVAVPEKKPVPEKLLTTLHEISSGFARIGAVAARTGDHEGRAVIEEDALNGRGAPERELPPEDSDPVPGKSAAGEVSPSGPGNAERAEKSSPGERPASKAEKADVETAAATPAEDALRDNDAPEKENPAAVKPSRAPVALPVRKPPKPRYDPAARSKSKDAPKKSGRKTREQQCVALTLCRAAFSKCRFSKERDKTDEEGWEIHKKYCGDQYQKCITKHFGEGEMFFTRWFLPYDPCS